MRRLLFGRSGETRESLSWFHWNARYVFTWASVVLVHGESWREYKRNWAVKPRRR